VLPLEAVIDEELVGIPDGGPVQDHDDPPVTIPAKVVIQASFSVQGHNIEEGEEDIEHREGQAGLLPRRKIFHSFSCSSSRYRKWWRWHPEWLQGTRNQVNPGYVFRARPASSVGWYQSW